VQGAFWDKECGGHGTCPEMKLTCSEIGAATDKNMKTTDSIRLKTRTKPIESVKIKKLYVRRRLMALISGPLGLRTTYKNPKKEKISVFGTRFRGKTTDSMTKRKILYVKQQ